MKQIITIILAIVAMTVQGQVKCRVEGTLSNKEFYEKYKDKGFTVIGVAHEDKLSDMTRAAEKDGYPWQNFIDLNDELKIWQKNGLGLGGGGMFLVDSKGVILSTSTDATELEPLIRKALGLE